MNVLATTSRRCATLSSRGAITSNAAAATSPTARARNGTYVPSAVRAARMSCRPSQRSIRSSPERRNSSSEPAMSSGVWPSLTQKLTGNVCERSGAHADAQFFEAKADAAFNRPQGQAGCVGDLLMRLAADEGTTNQVGLTRRQAVHQAPQQLCAAGRGQLLQHVLRLRVEIGR